MSQGFATATGAVLASTALSAWTTGAIYQPGNLVTYDNIIWMCILGHSSGTFSTDWLTNGYWSCVGDEPGTVKQWSGSSAPTGWFMCDGSLKSNTTYSLLYAVVGTTYGSGSGTFGVPNMRGKYPVGMPSGGTLGLSVGTILTDGENRAVGQHTHTQDAHTHTQNAHTHTQNSHAHSDSGHSHPVTNAMHRSAGGVAPGGNLATTSTYPSTDTGYANISYETATNQNTTATNNNATATNQNAGSVAGTNAPYIQMNFIIKY